MNKGKNGSKVGRNGRKIKRNVRNIRRNGRKIENKWKLRRRNTHQTLHSTIKIKPTVKDLKKIG